VQREERNALTSKTNPAACASPTAPSSAPRAARSTSCRPRRRELVGVVAQPRLGGRAEGGRRARSRGGSSRSRRWCRSAAWPMREARSHLPARANNRGSDDGIVLQAAWSINLVYYVDMPRWARREQSPRKGPNLGSRQQ
jgi:hypothetical protein